MNNMIVSNPIEMHHYFKLTEISMTEMKFQNILASCLSMTHVVLITPDSHSVLWYLSIIHLLYWQSRPAM